MSIEKTSPAKIFISHQSSDVEIANTLSELITNSFNLNSEKVICTSSKGQGLQNANDSYQQIKRDIDNALLVIYLISNEFCKSEDCLYEVAWGYEKEPNDKFLIHLDGVKSPNKPKLLIHSSMDELNEHGLIVLKSRIASKLNKTPDENKWVTYQTKLLEIFKRKEFLTSSNGKMQVDIPEDNNMLKILKQAIDFYNDSSSMFWTIEQMFHAIGLGKAYIEREIKKALKSGHLYSTFSNYNYINCNDSNTKFRITDKGIDYMEQHNNVSDL